MNERSAQLDAVIRAAAEKLSCRCPNCGAVPVGYRCRAIRLMSVLRRAMFPDVFGTDSDGNAEECLIEAARLLRELLADSGTEGDIDEILCRYLAAVPTLRDILCTDVQAAYEGDPAARSTTEIMLTYPAFEAISIFRLAHELYVLKVPMLPRLMTEYAHRITGIDIHPGATVGRYFFIDHGTGVVIGETCTIGDHVKLYQGVTLGAKSFELDENGNPVKGIKRHPDIGNHVVIYAGATILGGRTRIGDGCVVGGNVWLTHSLNPGETISYDAGTRMVVRPAKSE
ncbi:MAG: serine acetyltransferase [Oscillospiraceae bacterium]|nr:serine acetyltransferase [Oscillospiraceae bacterium]